jgi:hypothetical protein
MTTLVPIELSMSATIYASLLVSNRDSDSGDDFERGLEILAESVSQPEPNIPPVVIIFA